LVNGDALNSDALNSDALRGVGLNGGGVNDVALRGVVLKPFALKRAAMDAMGPKGRPHRGAQARDPWSPPPHDRATAPSGMEGLPLACRSALVATFHRWRN
jgi:hypothetical protein